MNHKPRILRVATEEQLASVRSQLEHCFAIDYSSIIDYSYSIPMYTLSWNYRLPTWYSKFCKLSVLLKSSTELLNQSRPSEILVTQNPSMMPGLIIYTKVLPAYSVQGPLCFETGQSSPIYADFSGCSLRPEPARTLNPRADDAAKCLIRLRV